MGRLTTHVLDLAHGRPAAGVRLRLLRLDGGGSELAATATDANGRALLIEGAGLTPGRYAIEFAVGDYFAAAGVALAEPRFLDVVSVRFGIAEADQGYHVPLLVSPFGYTTYRGS